MYSASPSNHPGGFDFARSPLKGQCLPACDCLHGSTSVSQVKTMLHFCHRHRDCVRRRHLADNHVRQILSEGEREGEGAAGIVMQC